MSRRRKRIFKKRLFNMRFKVVLLGNSDVGKTSMVLRLKNDNFDGGADPTIGTALGNYTTYLSSECSIKLGIWDTGNISFNQVLFYYRRYYPGTHAIIIIYDITNRTTFLDAKQRLDDIQHYISEIPIPHPQLILAGNKNDLSHARVISQMEGVKLAKYNNMKFYETSAKTGQNVKEMFDDIAKELAERYFQKLIEYPTEHEPDPPSQKNKSNRKCVII